MNRSNAEDLMLNFLFLWDTCVIFNGKCPAQYSTSLKVREKEKEYYSAYLMFAWW